MSRKAGHVDVSYRNRLVLSATSLVFEVMRERDIPAVAAIERVSFPTPFPAHVFRAELSSPASVWWVVHELPGGRRLWPLPVVAYVGYFFNGEGVHIAKIATDPRWRRRHLGEWALLNMLLVAGHQGAAHATLEVRATNAAARALYAKWGFIELRNIEGYYEDTGETGIILGLPGLTHPAVRERLAEALRCAEVLPPNMKTP